jgi:putative dimethyl sulfoxide reductase chaperone
MNERLMIHEARLNIYALLQRLYQNAPDAELLNWLKTEGPFADFPVRLDGDAGVALQQVDEALRALEVEELRADFRQLYVGPGPMTAPAWESVYRNEDHLLFDKHTLQVRAFYARHGMEFVEINKAPEDALSIELEFMRTLAERIVQAINDDDVETEQNLVNEQLLFLKQHLLIWVPKCVKLTQKHAKTAFYSNLADVLQGFLIWDEQTLTMLQASITDIVTNDNGS